MVCLTFLSNVVCPPPNISCKDAIKEFAPRPWICPSDTPIGKGASGIAYKIKTNTNPSATFIVKIQSVRSYIDLENYLQNTNLPIYGTFMDGINVYQQQLPVQGILVMGNEANGISKNIERLVTHKIAIPRFGTHQKTESLNVASATAIFLSEFKRNC